MTDINGTPILSIAPVASPTPGIAIAEIPIELERGQSVVEMKVKAPGIVRAVALWLQTPSVIGSANMRSTEKVAMPLLFVECDPAGELQERVFLFLPSGRPFAPREGFTAVHRATAVGQAGALHVFEIVEVGV
jgi:hypothetical protein